MQGLRGIGDTACEGTGATMLRKDAREDLVPLQTTRRSLPMSLLRAREAVMANFRPMLARHDVTEQQWRVIRVLGEESPLDASEVAARASILAPSLTRIIKALEDRKFIIRGKFEDDARRVLLAIAPAGMALIDQVQPERTAIYDAIEARIGRERIDDLLDLLELIIGNETRGA